MAVCSWRWRAGSRKIGRVSSSRATVIYASCSRFPVTVSDILTCLCDWGVSRLCYPNANHVSLEPTWMRFVKLSLPQ